MKILAILLFILTFQAFTKGDSYMEPPGSFDSMTPPMQQPVSGINVPQLNFSPDPCPFKDSGEQLNSFWENTKNVVESLASNREQMSAQCPSLSSSSTALQSSLQDYLNYEGFNYVTCNNFSLIYSAELQSVQSHAAKNTSPYYVTTPELQEYFSACNEYYDEDPANYRGGKYLDDFQECAEEVYDEKMEKQEIACAHEENLDDLQTQQDKFNQYMELLPAIQQSIQGLASAASGCDNKALRQSALTSVLDLTTTIASTAMGGLGGVVAAFGGGILIESIKALFSNANYADLRSMQSEDDYKDLACFYFQSQQLYCNYEKERDASEVSYCYECRKEDALNILPNDFLRQAMSLQQMIASSGNQREEMVNQVHEQLQTEIENGKTLQDFMLEDVLTTLYRQDTPRKQALIDYINAIKAAKEHFGREISVMEMLSEAPKSNGDNEATLDGHISTIINFDMQGTLQEYQESINSSVDGFNLLEKNERVQQAREITLQNPSGFQYNMWTQANAAFINSTKDIFTTQLKAHYDAAEQNQGSFTDEELAFSFIEPLIKDCILAQGVQFIPKSRNGNYSANVERSREYERYCSQLECDGGLTHFRTDDRENTRQHYNHIQCLEYDRFPGIMQTFRDSFKRDRKICGRDASDFLRHGGHR